MAVVAVLLIHMERKDVVNMTPNINLKRNYSMNQKPIIHLQILVSKVLFEELLIQSTYVCKVHCRKQVS